MPAGAKPLGPQLFVQNLKIALFNNAKKMQGIR
jgi:hypothetical protein